MAITHRPLSLPKTNLRTGKHVQENVPHQSFPLFMKEKPIAKYPVKAW